MPTLPEAVFHYEVQKSGDESKGAVTTITCHGRLVSEHSGQLKQAVKPLIAMGRRIVLDLTDVSYHDAGGRARFVGLRVSAVNGGFCKLEFCNPAPVEKPREPKARGLRVLSQLLSS